MDVSFLMAENTPYLALSVMPIDEDTLSDISVENGSVMNDGNHKVLVGWAVPAWTKMPNFRHISP